jgi:LysM repeat protein
MSVLTLAGKPIDWAKPPKATARVMWDKRDIYGRYVTGSLRTVCHIDYLNEQAKREFGVGIRIIQPPYNRTVKASAGTHDYDACLDLYIPGVSWSVQQKFFRKHGFGAWWRRKSKAWIDHIHGFTLPPQEGKDRSDDFRIFGFTVGKYVDGGWSTKGRRYTSAQITSYYAHRSGLSGNARDDSWFPPDIKATIFNLEAYIARQLALDVVPPVKPSKPKPRTYKIKSGDTLSAIGAKYGVKWQDIAKWSKIKNPNKIEVGQTVYLEKP